MNQKTISVGEVSQYIRDLIAGDYALRRIAVSGEVSNLTYHRSGHIYFTLKDAAAALSCVMWASDRAGLGFRLKNGDSIVATGSVDVYLQQGKYQLYARKIELQGAGLLYEKYLALKSELEEMGMFAQEYKQPIPFYVKKLGIVTAPTGAAVQDIRNIALRRNPYVQLFLYPALVQGEGAAQSIVRGIRALDEMDLDCLIVGRGGGSLEDLWAFNEEEVARAIFSCRTPVISAVGHETDTTIADYVADLRAPTPSAAAELAVCDLFVLDGELIARRDALRAGMCRRIDATRERTGSFAKSLQHLSPGQQLNAKRQRAADLEEKLAVLIARSLEDGKTRRALLESRFRDRSRLVLTDRKQQLEKLAREFAGGATLRLREERHRMQLLAERWEGFSPLKKLRQGFSYAEDDAGRNISSIQDVREEMAVHIQVADGVIHTIVTGTQPRERES